MLHLQFQEEAETFFTVPLPQTLIHTIVQPKTLKKIKTPEAGRDLPGYVAQPPTLYCGCFYTEITFREKKEKSSRKQEAGRVGRGRGWGGVGTVEALPHREPQQTEEGFTKNRRERDICKQRQISTSPPTAESGFVSLGW